MAWQAAAIQGAASLGGGLLSRIGEKKREERYNLYNRQAASWKHQLDLMAWEKQNAYNHPSMQMERLKEAGLNPAMMYGKGNSGAMGQAGSIAPAAAPKVMASNANERMLQSMHHFMDLAVKQAQTMNIDQNTKKQKEETTLTGMKQATEKWNAIYTEHKAELTRLEKDYTKVKTSHEYWKEDKTSSEASMLRRRDYAQQVIQDDSGYVPYIEAERAKLKYFIEHTNNEKLRGQLLQLDMDWYWLQKNLIPSINAGSQAINAIMGSAFKVGRIKQGAKALKDRYRNTDLREYNLMTK